MRSKRTIIKIKVSAREKKLMAELKRIDARIVRARKGKASKEVLEQLKDLRSEVSWKQTQAAFDRQTREFERKYKIVYV